MKDFSSIFESNNNDKYSGSMTIDCKNKKIYLLKYSGVYGK